MNYRIRRDENMIEKGREYNWGREAF